MITPESSFHVPADVPKELHQQFIENYQKLTRQTGRIILMAADQKLEHLNDDFYGPGIPSECNDPERIFQIAAQAPIGALATHLGLIARYGASYPTINYVVKISGKTNIATPPKSFFKSINKDPLNGLLWTVNDVITLKNQSGLSICGIGATVYLGSSYEAEMLHNAAQMIFDAHQQGLIAIVWMYPRGRSVVNEKSGHLVAGAAGAAATLGADIVKIQEPKTDRIHSTIEWLSVATQAAGRTRVIVAGGSLKDTHAYLKKIYAEITIAHTGGCAIGRNLFQRPLHKAIALSNALAAIVYQQESVEKAIKLL